MKEVEGMNVLISPLNWGMGHVSRSIALITELVQQKNQVYFAGDEDQIRMVRSYHPDIKIIHHLGYPFRFGAKGNFGLDLAFSYPALNKRLKEERKEVEKYVSENKIDLVISDHRYGFLSEKVPSVLLTHQVNLPVKWHEQWVQKIHHNLLAKFNRIWVPDYEDSRLSGDLSKNPGSFDLEFIGPLSRFKDIDKDRIRDLEVVIMISGPDVYGEKFLKKQMKNAELRDAIYLVSPFLKEKFEGESNVIATSDWTQSDQLILKTKKLIAPSGYSTIMDLEFLNIASDLTPTVGQREQEYLYKLRDK